MTITLTYKKLCKVLFHDTWFNINAEYTLTVIDMTREMND